MTPFQRVLTALSHQEPDRVPLFFTFTVHGARELGLSIKDYFSRPEHVVEGQLLLQKKYQHDILYSFFYAAVEIEAWNGAVIYIEDGPPNSARPFIQTPEQIHSLEVPDILRVPALVNVLDATRQLKARVGDTLPIVGVVMSPFSLPVMQMGFEHYLDLIYDHPVEFARLMAINEQFCTAWANAQLDAGATAIGYFDPVSSPTIIPRDLYQKTGFPIAQRMISRIKGPIAMLLASGLVLPILDDILETGSVMVGASSLEDLAETKAHCRGKLTVVGNLNAIAMCRWTAEQAESMVKQVIASAASGGGFILCDNHGEIPWQVPDKVLLAVSEAVRQWGTYPLEWLRNEDANTVHRRL